LVPGRFAHLEALRERVEKVAQTDEHYRELLINDLEDVRTLLGDLGSGGGGGSRDRSAPPARTTMVMGAGLESDDLTKVTETVRRLNREQMAALASFVGEVRALPARLATISSLSSPYLILMVRRRDARPHLCLPAEGPRLSLIRLHSHLHVCASCMPPPSTWCD